MSQCHKTRLRKLFAGRLFSGVTTTLLVLPLMFISSLLYVEFLLLYMLHAVCMSLFGIRLKSILT